MTDAERIERMKDVAHDLGFRALRGTLDIGHDSWRTIEVRHSALFSDAPDGWDVDVKEDSL